MQDCVDEANDVIAARVRIAQACLLLSRLLVDYDVTDISTMTSPYAHVDVTKVITFLHESEGLFGYSPVVLANAAEYITALTGAITALTGALTIPHDTFVTNAKRLTHTAIVTAVDSVTHRALALAAINTCINNLDSTAADFHHVLLTAGALLTDVGPDACLAPYYKSSLVGVKRRAAVALLGWNAVQEGVRLANSCWGLVGAVIANDITGVLFMMSEFFEERGVAVTVDDSLAVAYIAALQNLNFLKKMVSDEQIISAITDVHVAKRQADMREAALPMIIAIQSHIRGMYARQHFLELQRQHAAAIMIQAMYRGALVRRVYRRRLAFLSKQGDAALKIQSIWRGYKIRSQYKLLTEAV